MRHGIIAALLLLATAGPLCAETRVGKPFPGLASECTPAIPGIACSNPDPLGVGRVEMYSGEYFLDEDDLVIAGSGFDFVMRRSYRSRAERNVKDYSAHGDPTWDFVHSALGRGWDFSYDIWLESVPVRSPIGCSEVSDGEMSSLSHDVVTQMRVHLGNGRTQMLHRQVSLPFRDLDGDGYQALPAEPCRDDSDGTYIVSDFRNYENWTWVDEQLPDDRYAPTDLGGFTLHFGDGSRWHFKTHFRSPFLSNWHADPPIPGSEHAFQDSFRAVCDWIEDANGNRMHLLYEWPETWTPQGHPTVFDVPRVVGVVDTLGRLISFEYDVTPAYTSDGEHVGNAVNLKSIRDWTNRTVTYEYDPYPVPGVPGQLNAVTRPRVKNTPLLVDGDSASNNDFPDGNTRRYLYHDWEAHPGLPYYGLLRAILDESGRELVRLEHSTGRSDFVDAWQHDGYGPFCDCTDESGFNRCENETTDWRRVTRHVVGGQGTWFDYVRLPLTYPVDLGGGVPCTHREMLRCTTTDPAGNVTVTHFNRFNLVSRKREYVGRAHPDAPALTSVGESGAVLFTSNPPVAPLRSVDPASSPGLKSEHGHSFYETVHQYNTAGLPMRTYLPNSTSRGTAMRNSPRTEYIYRASPHNLDPALVPHCTFGVLSCTRGLPRHVVRRGTDTGDPSWVVGHVTDTSYDIDDRFPGSSSTIRHAVQGTRHLGEPEMRFTHDDQGNKLTKSVVVAPHDVVLLESWEYEDIEVEDLHVPGGMRRVRRLSAVTFPPHDTDGREYRQRDEYEYWEVSVVAFRDGDRDTLVDGDRLA